MVKILGGKFFEIPEKFVILKSVEVRYIMLNIANISRNQNIK